MRLSVTLDYTQDVRSATEQVRRLERAGVDIVWLQEGYSFDAVSAAGYLAAWTETIQIGTAILNVYSRTPALLAMTAAGLDQLSGGRFLLGLGASGPQVVEGFHGVPHDLPRTRIEETIAVCRQVWRREPLAHRGTAFAVPLSADARPLKLVNRPLREAVPIYWAALGDRSVEATAELADGWLPFFFVPERAGPVFGPALQRGKARRSAGLAALDVVAPVTVAIGDAVDEDRALARARSRIALYVGGMGSRTTNYYNDLAGRFGWEQEAGQIQKLFLDGRRQEAEAAVPDEWLRLGNLVGSQGWIADRLQAYREAGVTVLDLSFSQEADPVSTVEALRRLLDA